MLVTIIRIVLDIGKEEEKNSSVSCSLSAPLQTTIKTYMAHSTTPCCVVTITAQHGHGQIPASLQANPTPSGLGCHNATKNWPQERGGLLGPSRAAPPPRCRGANGPLNRGLTAACFGYKRAWPHRSGREHSSQEQAEWFQHFDGKSPSGGTAFPYTRDNMIAHIAPRIRQ